MSEEIHIGRASYCPTNKLRYVRNGEENVETNSSNAKKNE